MGPTGSGKTTLAMLMARFTDVTGGSVKIDGVDVKDYDLNALRAKDCLCDAGRVPVFQATIDTKHRVR